MSWHAIGLTEQDYTLGQLRYDRGKLRAHRLAERAAPAGATGSLLTACALAPLLVKIRTRLLGPIFAAPSVTA